jgi:hypothetical protein
MSLTVTEFPVPAYVGQTSNGIYKIEGSTLTFAAPPAEESRCGHHHATCSWPCASEGHRSLACHCGQDDEGTWRWQYSETGPVCSM